MTTRLSREHYVRAGKKGGEVRFTDCRLRLRTRLLLFLSQREKAQPGVLLTWRDLRSGAHVRSDDMLSHLLRDLVPQSIGTISVGDERFYFLRVSKNGSDSRQKSAA